MPGSRLRQPGFFNLEMEYRYGGENMPSAKILAEKKAATEALTEKVKSAVAGVVVNYTGITVEDDTVLRSQLRKAGVSYHVYKNTMVERACDAAGYGDMKQYLTGMNAFAISESDPVAAESLSIQIIRHRCYQHR